MGFSLKKVGAGLLSPVALAGTALSLGRDIGGAYFEHQENKDAREAQERVNRENAALQREFAQMGITWKVEDARRAGIHPLAALGASTQGATPSFQVGETDRSRSNLIRNMGQDISRSMVATMTPQERAEGILRLERMGLENQLIRKQLDQTGPPMPSGGTDNFMGGQGDSGVMLVEPSRRVSHAPGRPAQEAGARPDVSYSRSDTGLVPVIPQGLSESMEDDLIGKLFWRIRNQVKPNLMGSGKPPKSQLPPGAQDWRFDRFNQEWRPYRHDWKKRSFLRETYDKFRYGGN